MQEQSEIYTYKHIVIVHGMGEAAPNETALCFMNEFLRSLPRDREKGYSVDVFNLVESVDEIKETEDGDKRNEDDPPRPRRSFTPAYLIFKNKNDLKAGKEQIINHVIGFSEVYWKQIPDHYLEKNDGHPPIPISTWAHSVNTRFMRDIIGSEEEPGREVYKRNTARSKTEWRNTTYRRFRKVTEVINNVEKMLGILTRLATIYKKSGELARVTIEYLGDVQMYAESKAIRQEINNRFLSIMSRISIFSNETAEELKKDKKHGVKFEAFAKELGEDKKNEYSGFEDIEIYVIAHSQGTVISYNSLVQAAMMIEGATDKKTDSPKLIEYEEKLVEEFKKNAQKKEEKRGSEEPSRKATEEAAKEAKPDWWLPKVKGLVTFGTPIDKFYTIWENRFRRDNLEKSDSENSVVKKVKKIPWLNFWDRSDPFAHGLNALITKEDGSEDPDADATKLFVIKHDKGFSRYFIPALAHIKYWKDRAIYQDIIYRVMRLDTTSDKKREMEEVTNKEKNRVTPNPPETTTGQEKSRVTTNPLVFCNIGFAYLGYFLGRLLTLFLLVFFFNRLIYPIQTSWLSTSSGTSKDWIYFFVWIILPFAAIWLLEEASFFCTGFGEKLIKWLRKLLVVGWWIWAFILCLLWPPDSDLIRELFFSDNGEDLKPTLMDRAGYLTSLVVLCFIWKLHTAVHRGLIQMWSYTLGRKTGIPDDKLSDQTKKVSVEGPASGD